MVDGYISEAVMLQKSSSRGAGWFGQCKQGELTTEMRLRLDTVLFNGVVVPCLRSLQLEGWIMLESKI